MKKSLLQCIALCAFFAVCLSCSAQEKPHPIDTWLEKATEKDPSTAAVKQATYYASDMWDKEMNKSYQHLMKRLPKEKQEILRESQKQWIKFRDADREVLSRIVADQQGRIYQVTDPSDWLELVRSRALQLDEYDK